MFIKDIERIRICILYNDYYSALEYAILVKDNYLEERKYFNYIISCIKTAKYEELKQIVIKILNLQHISTNF